MAFTDHNVQPVEQAGVWVIGLVFMGVPLQYWIIVAVTVAPDRAAHSK